MSYSIDLLEPVTRNVIELDHPHFIRGAQYAVGGTTKLTLNVTYNYGKIYYHLFGEQGIRFLYDKSAHETIVPLQEAIAKLKDDVDDNYWNATEGNAKQALISLLTFAQMRPDGIWTGD